MGMFQWEEEAHPAVAEKQVLEEHRMSLWPPPGWFGRGLCLASSTAQGCSRVCVSHSRVAGSGCGCIREVFQQQVSQCLRSCLAGIGLAKRQHSAVPLVDSVFFPDNGLTTPSLITVMNSASW